MTHSDYIVHIKELSGLSWPELANRLDCEVSLLYKIRAGIRRISKLMKIKISLSFKIRLKEINNILES